LVCALLRGVRLLRRGRHLVDRLTLGPGCFARKRPIPAIGWAFFVARIFRRRGGCLA
jgi:hypothetical protein